MKSRKLPKAMPLSVLLLATAHGSALAQNCSYLGGYPWKNGGCLVADDLNNAIAGRNPFLNFSPRPHQWIAGFDRGEPLLAQPLFADIGGALLPGQLPPPSLGTLGGVYSHTSPAHQFFYALDSQGALASRQPTFLDVAGVAGPAQIPFPAPNTIGGVKAFTAPAGQFITGITTTGGYTTAAASGAGAGLPSGAEGDRLVFRSGAWATERPLYIVGCYVPGAIPLNQVLLFVPFTAAVRFPANFAVFQAHSSQARGGANATGIRVFDVRKATAAAPNTFVSVGAITVSAGSSVGVLTTTGGTALDFAPGDTLSLVAPATTDATFVNFAASLVGYEL